MSFVGVLIHLKKSSAFKEAFSERSDVDTASALSVRVLVRLSLMPGSVSPAADSQPVGLSDCLPAADSEWLQAWQEHMLSHLLALHQLRLFILTLIQFKSTTEGSTQDFSRS